MTLSTWASLKAWAKALASKREPMPGISGLVWKSRWIWRKRMDASCQVGGGPPPARVGLRSVAAVAVEEVDGLRRDREREAVAVAGDDLRRAMHGEVALRRIPKSKAVSGAAST